jgi:SpoVK/Ycf46/Vps4 family AAA+-type ATPase
MSLEVKTFLESETPLPKVIVVYGPTACGKSALAVETAKYIMAR